MSLLGLTLLGLLLRALSLLGLTLLRLLLRALCLLRLLGLTLLRLLLRALSLLGLTLLRPLLRALCLLSLLRLTLLRLLLRALRLLRLLGLTLLRLLLGALSLRWRRRLRRRGALPASLRIAGLHSLVILLGDGVLRTVTIVLSLQYLLLVNMRITVAGILPLIRRQRGRRRHRTAVPAIPTRPMLLPRATPMLAPVRWSARGPAPEIGRRPTVITNRNAKNIERYRDGFYELPWTVVPSARIPVVVDVDPVHPVVEE